MTAELSNKARAEVRRHRLLAIGAILIAAVYVDQQRRAAASRGKGV